MSQLVPRPFWVLCLAAATSCTVADAGLDNAETVDQTASVDPCAVSEIRHVSAGQDALKVWAPDGLHYAINKKDAAGIYQVYVGARDSTAEPTCISCTARWWSPQVDRHKMQVQWHPSGRWLIMGGEKAWHDNLWYPAWLREGIVASGVWMDIYATTIDGGLWYRLVETTLGMTGPAWTADGKRAAWAEAIDGNVLVYPFGKWRLKIADLGADWFGGPTLVGARDITPAGASWVEPGNFAPDGTSLLLTMDLGITDAQGMDQFILDVARGSVTNLTRTAQIWDEHGLFSPDGSKVVFMSSYPYRGEPDAYKTLSLKTEFMMINRDGTGLRQLTHFRTPGYPEYGNAIAAVGFWNRAGTGLDATTLTFPGYDTWAIAFAGRCGLGAPRL